MIDINGKSPSLISYDGKDIGYVYVGDRLVWERKQGAFKIRFTLFDGRMISYPFDGNSLIDLSTYDSILSDVRKIEVGEGITELSIPFGTNQRTKNIEEMIFPMTLKVLNNYPNSGNQLKYLDIGGLEEIQTGSFAYSEKLHTVKLNEGLRVIGQNAFTNAYSLYDIEIPSTVESIGGSAFAIVDDNYKPILDENRKVRIYATNPPSLGNSIVFGYMATYPIYVLDECVDIYKKSDGFLYESNRVRPMSEYK